MMVDLEEILDSLAAEAAGLMKLSVSRTQKSANDIFVACPCLENHGNMVERTPSCSIHKEQGLVHCFGCNYSDSLPGYISRILQLNDRIKGYRWLLTHYSTPAKGQRQLIKLEQLPRREEDFVLPESALDPYNFDHPAMYKRGFTQNTVDLFQLGFDSVTKSITIPMRDQKDRLKFIKKRLLISKGFHKYHIDEGVEKTDLIYGINLIAANISRVKKIYLVEGEMDTISCYQAKKFAGGLQGDRLFPDQVKQLIRLARGIPICLLTDNDKAGRAARERAIPMLRPYFPLFEPVYPGNQYKDPNDLLKAGLLEDIEEIPIF